MAPFSAIEDFSDYRLELLYAGVDARSAEDVCGRCIGGNDDSGSR